MPEHIGEFFCQHTIFPYIFQASDLVVSQEPPVIVVDQRIIHLESGSINKDQQLEEKGYYNLYDRKGLQLMVSNHLRVRKQYGAGWFLFLLLQYTWGVFVFWLAGTIHRLFTLRNPFGHWNQVAAFARNVARLWSLSPKMMGNRPHFYKMF